MGTTPLAYCIPESLVREWETLEEDTYQWFQTSTDDGAKLVWEWYALMDEVRARVADEAVDCPPPLMRRLVGIIRDAPFPPRAPPEDVVRGVFLEYIQDISEAAALLADATCKPFDVAYRFTRAWCTQVRRLAWIWGPWCTSYTPCLVFTIGGSMEDTVKRWEETVLRPVNQQLEECYEAGRSLVVYFLEWRWQTPVDPITGKSEGLAHLTLWYADTQRRIQGLFDPNGRYVEDTTTIPEGICFVDFVEEHGLAGYRTDYDPDRPTESHTKVQRTFEPTDHTRLDSGYCVTMCLLVYLLMHRFACMRVQYVARILREIFVGRGQDDDRDDLRQGMCLWHNRLMSHEAAYPERLLHLLALKHKVQQPSRPCNVLLANGTFCDRLSTGHWRYCSDHSKQLIRTSTWEDDGNTDDLFPRDKRTREHAEPRENKHRRLLSPSSGSSPGDENVGVGRTVA